jgi:hypothetical protein
MNRKDQPLGNDPTIMGNERPRSDRDNEHLPRGEKVEHQDPRNGMNRPADDTSRPARTAEEKDEI